MNPVDFQIFVAIIATKRCSRGNGWSKRAERSPVALP